VSHHRPRALALPYRRSIPGLALVLGATLALGAGPALAQEASPASEGIDGSWDIDTSIEGFDQDLSSGSWVGFRVAEVLDPGGSTEAIGRTPLVAGSLVASGSVIESAVIEADLTGIRSDRDRREGAIQRALGTGEFPTARFEMTGPVDLGAVPPEGEPFSATLPGTLTIRDVSQDVTLELQGQRVGDLAVVVGTLPVDFTSFGVTMPTAPIVVSVEDQGDLEWQLYLSRAGDEAAVDPSAGPTDGSVAPDHEAAED
jgi:polyisoprenoid-binding protein YceI